ncbi:Uncharacterised protein [Pandoraea pulmonicola]|uniref:Uncharacterized protein n=1 Tax=Pandoraea pulmonicola TaxID=93221 RepID=A0AAJ4ZAD3_PANPU|nr:Uncharacterised protein [Pandoraea pulmonicola]
MHWMYLREALSNAARLSSSQPAAGFRLSQRLSNPTCTNRSCGAPRKPPGFLAAFLYAGQITEDVSKKARNSVGRGCPDRRQG